MAAGAGHFATCTLRDKLPDFSADHPVPNFIFMSVIENATDAAGQGEPGLLWTWGVPLAALLGLALLLFADGNVALFYVLNGAISHAGDLLWSNLTVLGDSNIALLFILPLLGRYPKLVWQFVLAALVATLMVQGVKYLFISGRPPLILPAGSFHLIGRGYLHYSFPSGHTTTIFVVAGFFCLQQLPNWGRSVLLLLAVLVGLSRIACGVHWPLDVLGGALVGWTGAAAGFWLARHWPAGENIWAQRLFALVITGIAVWCLWSYDNEYPSTQLTQFAVAGVCLALSLPGQLRLFRLRK